ncbi:glutathione S-transferase N-terminal domain-containing protein [Halomicrococcus sp. NG-SE-24]|uniref:glutathione S-transferase N-terminal domain-containing protein n=1 Tax=Halomicrococcus sp. NG-SE-24 TaxID=3436928 RepID=UPI003D990A93
MNQQRYDELKTHGQNKIPLLVDNEWDEVLYESDDIVPYLENHHCRRQSATASTSPCCSNVLTGECLQCLLTDPSTWNHQKPR